MFKLLMNKAELDRLQPVLDYLHSIDPRQAEVVEVKRKSYTWLIIVACFVGFAAIGIVVYKMFFEVGDEFDEFDDEDFEDIDFDDDYDEEFDEFKDKVGDAVEDIKEEFEEAVEEVIE